MVHQFYRSIFGSRHDAVHSNPIQNIQDPEKLVRKGYKLMKCGRYDEATDCLHDAFEAGAEENERLCVQLLFNLSDVTKKKGYLIESMHYFFKAKTYIANNPSPLHVAELIERDVFCNIEEALEAYKAALEYAIKTKNNQMHARALCKIGFIKIRMNQFDKATSCFSEGRQLSSNNSETQAMAFRGLGIALNRMNRFGLAEKHLRQAISIDHRLNYLDDLAKDLEELSYALFHNNQFKKSAACLLKASMLNQKLADPRWPPKIPHLWPLENPPPGHQKN